MEPAIGREFMAFLLVLIATVQMLIVDVADPGFRSAFSFAFLDFLVHLLAFISGVLAGFPCSFAGFPCWLSLLPLAASTAAEILALALPFCFSSYVYKGK